MGVLLERLLPDQRVQRNSKPILHKAQPTAAAPSGAELLGSQVPHIQHD